MKFSLSTTLPLIGGLASVANAAEFFLQNCEGTFKNGTVQHVMVSTSSDSSKDCGLTDHGNKTFERGGPFNFQNGNNLMPCQLHRTTEDKDEEVQGYAICGDGKNITLYYTKARTVKEWDCGTAKYKCDAGALTNTKSKASSEDGDDDDGKKKGGKKDDSDDDNGDSVDDMGDSGAMSTLVNSNLVVFGTLSSIVLALL